ncbi:Clavaminate synthase-like protein, partial [Sphaerulina musiva SO2202]
FTSIPTISLLPLFSPSSTSPSHLQSLAAEIHSACTTTGFFYATDHGIPLASQFEIFAVMEKFFRQVGEKEKMQEAHLHANPAMRGYEPLGETGRGRKGDLKEAFTIGDCVHDSEQVSFYQSLYPHSSPLPSIPRSQNIWPKPSSAPGFREGMYAYYREIFPVAMKLVEIFGVALGVDSHDDENKNGGGDGGLEKDFQWPIWGMR